MTKLEKIHPIQVCLVCHSIDRLGSKNHYRPFDGGICGHDAENFYSQSSLVELLKGRIEEYKVNVKFYGQPEISIVDKDNPTVKELQSLLSMIEGNK